MQTKYLMGITLIPMLASAQSFDLGKIDVVGTDAKSGIHADTLDESALELHNTPKMDQALDLLPGISIGSVGARGESTLTMRGLDAKRVGIFIDGVPIYVPYDGTFDFSRFVLEDVAQVDVSKGFSSALAGPNTMAGTINLVTKKPQKALEGRITAGIGMDSTGETNRYRMAANVGSRQEDFYIQLGASYFDQDHWRVSEDFDPNTLEDGDERERSNAKDQKVSLKAGYLAGDDEYTIGYLRQEAEKGNPPTTDESASARYWDWPYWDKSSIYFQSRTNIANGYVKTRFYHDTYENSLYSYDDDGYDSMTKGYAFKSNYDDYTDGGTLEGGVNSGAHLFRASLYYKKDVHRGYDSGDLTEHYEDAMTSIGLEDTWSIADRTDLVLGISADSQEGQKMEDDSLQSFPVDKSDVQQAVNPQVGIFYTAESWQSSVTLARKSHLPTMKDRYSRRFGKTNPNPDLAPEYATHLGWNLSGDLGENTQGTTALFYSDVTDLLQMVPDGLNDSNQTVFKNDNIGDFAIYGAELSLAHRTAMLEAGINYTYTTYEDKNGDGKLTGTPEHQVFAYGMLTPTEPLSLYLSMKYASWRYAGSFDEYEKIDGFTTADFKVILRPTDVITAQVGVQNLADADYQYEVGYPMEGRNYFANLNYRF